MSNQLTESDRAVLAQLLELQVSKKEIARRLHKHRSTVYREVARNTGPVGGGFRDQMRHGVWRCIG
jgi:IS30 family transposase